LLIAFIDLKSDQINAREGGKKGILPLEQQRSAGTGVALETCRGTEGSAEELLNFLLVQLK